MTTLSDSMIKSCAASAVAVTKSDSAANTYTYLYVGTGGNLAITPADGGSAVTLVGVPNGSFVWVRTAKVMSTNTTASDIVGFN